MGSLWFLFGFRVWDMGFRGQGLGFGLRGWALGLRAWSLVGVSVARYGSIIVVCRSCKS